MRIRNGAVVLSVAVLVGLAACGSDQADPPTTQAESATASAAPTECAGTVSLEPGAADGKPETVELPEVPPTDEVVATVLREGDGPEVTDLSYVTVHYAGIACSTGVAFDSSWDRGEPISAALGTATPTATASSVIPGWTTGLVGQVEGSLVQIDIPPSQAYGETGSPPAIGPNEPLTFVIELLEVSDSPPEP